MLKIYHFVCYYIEFCDTINQDNALSIAIFSNFSQNHLNKFNRQILRCEEQQN